MFEHEQSVEALRHGILFDSPSAEGEQSSLCEENDLYEQWKTSDLKTTSHRWWSYRIGDTEQNTEDMCAFQTISKGESFRSRPIDWSIDGPIYR